MIEIEKAKDLFRRHWGSVFFMSRNGVEEEYRALGVEPAQEQDWLEELRREKLGELGKEGNWMVVEFLNLHRQTGYLELLISSSPLGSFWEQCAYLEGLVEYCLDTEKPGWYYRNRVRQYLEQQLSSLQGRAWSAESSARVEAIRELAGRIGGQ